MGDHSTAPLPARRVNAPALPALAARHAGRQAGRRLPRALHPVAWWLWAIALAVAVSRTTNPLLLALTLAVLGFVVANRRSDAPWARAFRFYLWLALVVVAIRVIFRSIFATGDGRADHVLFTLPLVHTPHWYAGVHIGGPVSLEAVLAASFDGLRLGTVLCCIGAANVLANPKRALRVLPGALYELGVAVVVAMSVAPQLIESVQRVRRARSLRAGRGSGTRALRAITVPVLEDALERSLRLAAAMDSRGYGRVGTATARSRRLTATALLAGMVGLCIGAFGLLDAGAPGYLGVPCLVGGCLLCVGGLAVGSRRVHRTSYRPDVWRGAEWAAVGCGLVAAVAFLTTDLGVLQPATSPLQWPPLPPAPTIGLLVAALAGVITPAPATEQVAE